MTQTWFNVLLVFGTMLMSSTCTWAFVVKMPSVVRHPSSQLDAVGASFLSDANGLLISTIDSDIASIPNEQFGLVFAGGIMVMVGGVLSAVIVGFLLEKGDLYASVAAESYLQSEDDKEFWRGLSDEEQVKAKELMEKIRASKDGGSSPEAKPQPSMSATASTASTTESSPSKPADMFSDYGD